MKLFLSITFSFLLASTGAQEIVSTVTTSASFPLVSAKGTVPIVFDPHDDSLIHQAVNLFQKDVEMVTGKRPAVLNALPTHSVVIIGSLGKSKFIKQLVAEKKLATKNLINRWEAYQIQVIKNPFKGVAEALVIAGSDRRGTAYGVFELSKQIGVSPWYWWADVPVKEKKELYISSARVIADAPKVKYRGIFLNDEAPALSGWSREKFGGFNSKFYEKVFELMLRLKANYLWPAMWGNAFYADDPANKQAADKYGIVIGTSHHEPLMRAHDEWRRYGGGKWNYDSNAIQLQQFWREGMQRATNEKIVSIGMRGDGDEPMSRETATALLERIVADQRKIITEVTGKPAEQTPQLWALYKEVQDYYDKGMRVPDDVTLLLCDDNWGNLRKLPKPGEPRRKGGYGIYYHFDYVGGPRNYKWLNTNNLARVWEQMHLAYQHGVKDIWIVNVGDLKPMELPISFFLDYGWNPDKWNETNLRSYYDQWAGQQFAPKLAKQIGEVLSKYALYSARRKPELLDANTYSLTNYNEVARIEAQWNSLLAQAESLNEQVPAAQRDAYFQLVLHPVQAVANLHQLYFAVAKNRFYAAQNNPLANQWAEKAKACYLADSLLTIKYNKELAGGKWNHMMDQTHIGYRSWQEPRRNTMPDVKYVNADSSKATNAVFQEENPATGSYTAIMAKDYTKAVNGSAITWKSIPDIGREGDGMTTFPVTATAPTNFTATSPRLEYNFQLTDTGAVKLSLYFSPTLNFYNEPEGLQYAISINNEKPQVFSLNKEDKNSISGIWNTWVANNCIVKSLQQNIRKPGTYTISYWAVSPGVVLQKLAIEYGTGKPSYLGPPPLK